MADAQRFPEMQRERIISGHAGANNRVVPWLVEDHSAAQLVNLLIQDVGKKVQRTGAQGFGACHDQSEPGGLDFYNTVTFDDQLLAAFGPHLFYSDGDGAWLQVASSVSLARGQLHQFVRGRNAGELAVAICSCEEPTDASNGLNGHSLLTIWNIESDTETQVSLAPWCLGYMQNRLFYGEDETLGWSDIGDLGNVSDANTLLIEPGIGGPITAIVPTRDLDPKILIFKENAIALFSPRWGGEGDYIPVAGDALDTLNSSVRLLSRGAGCIATLSAQWVVGEEGAADVFFLSRDGVRSLARADNDTPVGAGFPLSYGIKGWIDRINFAAAHRAVASVFDNAYHLAVPMDGANDNTHILRYDLATKAWSLHTWEARAIANARLGGTERLWMQNNFLTVDSSTTGPLATSASQVYRLYSGTFDPSTDATNVTRIIHQDESKALTLGDPTAKKRWDHVTLQFSSGATSIFELAYRRDAGQYNTITEITVSGSLGTIVLGEEQLPWTPSADRTRFITFPLSDLTPSYHIQFRLGGVTGSTEAGQLSTYMLEAAGHVLPHNVKNDD